VEEQIERRELECDLIEPELQPRRIYFDEDEIYYMDSAGNFWDEMSGKALNHDEVIAARLDEIKQIHSHDVYEKVPIDLCWQVTGKAPVKVKWIDLNKGDDINHDYRSRLVAKELKMDKRLDLFAATPPLEAKKALFSAAVTEGLGYINGDKTSGKKIDFIDISRAFFQADAIREVFVELPAEDYEPGMCARLKKSMYGTRDAAQNWGHAYSGFLVKIGFVRGESSPCVFFHDKRELRCVVHGDDFTILGWEKDLDWFWKEISTAFESKHRGRLGPGPHDLKEMRILNRAVTWTKEGLTYEADQRHVEICLRDVNLENATSVSTPVDRSSKDPKNRNEIVNAEKTSEALVSSAATHYRAIVARLNYLGQDRSDIQFAVKELGKDMCTPTQASWTRMKRALRYLKGAPRALVHFGYQERPQEITIWADSDFAGCERTRKSTSAGVIMFGSHLIKSWSTNQAVPALSSGEAEYYALVKAASMGIGVRSLASELGINYCNPLRINSDASAAIGICNRIGSGKIRHLAVTQLWLQHQVADKSIVLSKVGTDENLADALTKGVDHAAIHKHNLGVGVELRADRHSLAPALAKEESADLKLEGEV